MLRFRSQAALWPVLALGGCGGSSHQNPSPPTSDDAGSAPDAGAPSDDASAAPDVSDGSTSGAIMACAESTTPVTMAPADTADPLAPVGAYRWKNVEIVAGGFVSGVIFSPAQQDIVYARTDIGGAYRWNAATRRWMPLLDWVGRNQANWIGVESIAPDPKDANKVYIAGGTYVVSGPGAILRSSDRGKTFQAATTQIPMGGNNDGRSVGERLAVDPNQTSTLYFGSRTMGLWKSVDGAVTWAQVTSFPGLAASAAGPVSTPNGVGITFVQFDPRNCGNDGKTVVYVAIAVSGTSLYRSSDGGVTWVAVPGQPTGLLPSHAALSKTGMLYVTYGGGTGNNGSGPNNVTTGAVHRLDTSTGTWTNVTPMVPAAPTPFGYAGVSVDAANPDTVVVCTLDRWSIGDEIFRTTDGGATWKPIGLRSAPHDVSAAPWVTFHQPQPNFTGWMGDVEIDPFNSARVLHITGQGIWASDDITAADTNQPTHWDFRSQGIEETAVLDLASPPSGPALLSAVGDIGGFRHDDLTVTPPEGMSSTPVFSSTDSVDFAESDPTMVVRIGRGGGNTAPHGALSTDGGATWSPFVLSLPIPTASAGSIAISADGATLVWDLPPNTRGTATAGGPQYSRDLGDSWTPSTGLGAIRPVISDRANPDNFYAFDGATGRVFASTDRGATFAVAGTGLPVGGGRLRATPGIAGDLWLITGGGLFHSTDAGSTFAPIRTGSVPFAVGLGAAPPGRTYPAVYLGGAVNGVEGFFRSDDAGDSWVRIDDDQHRFGNATILIGDPRVYGRVYIGTNGRGILYGEPAASAPQ